MFGSKEKHCIILCIFTYNFNLIIFYNISRFVDCPVSNTTNKSSYASLIFYEISSAWKENFCKSIGICALSKHLFCKKSSVKMPLRFLFRYLANNEQLVQKIAESYPVRKAARFCVAMYYRTQNIARESLPPVDKIDASWLRSFLSRFKDNLSHGIKDAQQQLKGKGNKHWTLVWQFYFKHVNCVNVCFSGNECVFSKLLEQYIDY